MRTVLMTTGLVLLAGTLSAKSVMLGPTVRLTSVMREAAKDGFSGVVLATRRGEIIFSEGFGWADKERGVPFRPETVFDVGSLTKQFTAAAIIKLETMGKLQVSDVMSKHLAGVPEDKSAVTLHHLLTHTAGFKESLGDDYAECDGIGFLKLAFASKLRHAPGEKNEYSNVGYSILGIIVEKVSGMGYEEFLRKELFTPAGLESTGYILPDWSKRVLAHGYKKDWNDIGTPLDHAWAADGPWWHLKANGGILSTVGDLHRWHQALAGDKVLSRDAVAKLQTPHVRESRIFTSSHYGYGWVIEKTDDGKTMVSHNGSNRIFYAEVRRLIETDTVLIVASNRADFMAMRIVDKVWTALTEEQ